MTTALISFRDTIQPGDVSYRRVLQVVDAVGPPNETKNNVKSRFESLPFPSPSLLPSSSPSLSPSPSVIFLSPSQSPFSPSDLPLDPPSPSLAESSISSPAASPAANFLPGQLSPKLPPSSASPVPLNPSMIVSAPQPTVALVPSSAPTPTQMLNESSSEKHHTVIILSGVFGSSLLIFISAMGIIFYKSKKMVTVKPWVTGLSGQLQKAFVTG